MDTDEAPAPASALERGDGDLSLVEISPGYAVLYGDRVPDRLPEGLEKVPFELMSSHAKFALTDKLSTLTGAGNTAIQASQGLVNAQGLVRLSPQTLQALQQGQAMTSGGWNLGSIVNSQGNITASVRWAPAAGAQSAAVLATLGPAAALLAVQVQLASISRRINENIALTQTVLQELHYDHWTTLLGLHETTVQAVRDAHAIGVVNDHVYRAIESKEPELRKMRHIFGGYLKQHIAGMNVNLYDQRRYIHQHSQQIFADIHGIIMAELAWYRAQSLRAGNILYDEARAQENEALLADLAERTPREHHETMQQIADLLETLQRQCHLMAELSPVRKFAPTRQRTSAKEAAAMATALAHKVAELRGVITPEPATPNPPVTVFKEAEPRRPLNILRWVIPRDEPLLALASVNTSQRVNNAAYLGITPRHFFITSEGNLGKFGQIDRQFPLNELRYVRFKERGKAGPALDLITTQEDVRITFNDYAHEGDSLAGARKVGDMLATAMHIPESEQRLEPIMVEALSTSPAKAPHLAALNGSSYT